MAVERFRRILPLAVLLVLALVSAGVAQEYTIGVENTQLYPIYGFRLGQYRGFSRELLDAFASKHGYRFKYVGYPIVPLYVEYLEKNSLDFKYPDSPTWRTGLKAGIAISYSTAVYKGMEATMVTPDRLGRPLAAIKTLGIVRGFLLRPYQAQIAAGSIDLRESDNMPSLVQSGLQRRVDAILIHERVAAHHLTQELKKPGALVVDPDLPSNEVAYMLSSRKHPQVIAEFNEFLASETPLIASLRAKYRLD